MMIKTHEATQVTAWTFVTLTSSRYSIDQIINILQPGHILSRLCIMGLLFKHCQTILPILPGIEKHVDPPQLASTWRLKASSDPVDDQILGNWMSPPKKQINIFTMLFFHIKKNPEGFFGLKKPVLHYVYRQKKKLETKKSCVSKTQPSPFFVVTKGRLRLLSWLHLHQCLTDRPYFRDSSGPYLGGSSAPSKWFFVTMVESLS